MFHLEGEGEAIEIVNDIKLSNIHRHIFVDYPLYSRHCSRPWEITVSQRVKKSLLPLSFYPGEEGPAVGDTSKPNSQSDRGTSERGNAEARVERMRSVWLNWMVGDEPIHMVNFEPSVQGRARVSHEAISEECPRQREESVQRVHAETESRALENPE